MTPPASPASPTVARLAALWETLTRPHSRIAADLGARSRTLAALGLIGIPVMWLISTWSWLGAPLQTFLLFTPLLLIPAFLINRAGYYRVAAWIAVLYLAVMPLIFLLSLRFGTVATVTFGAMWLLAPLFISYILLDFRDLIFTLLLIFGIIIVVLLLNPAITFSLLSVSLLILLWSTILMLIAGVLRQHDSRDRLGQSAALTESEARYRTLFESTMEGIIVHHQGVVIDCNPAFANLLGYTREEIRGMSAISFYAPEERDRAQDLMRSTEPYQAQGIRKDGTRFWAEIHGRPIVVNGRIVRVAAIVDITQRRAAEQQVVKLAVEQEKVNILQRFITNISHDLRTPLSTINTGLYLIDKVKDSPERLEAQIASVQEQVTHLERLIDDLLSMSRLDRRATGEYSFKWSELNPVVSMAVEEQSSFALRRRQVLSFHPGDNLPSALIDAAELRRMVQHLVQNAINFTPEGGEVSVSTYGEGEEIVIAVRDTGIGISAQDQAHIFDYFYRGDRARSTETGGTGLGLTIARRICEAHNGRIEVESAPGVGSVFRVRLPVTRRAALASHPE